MEPKSGPPNRPLPLTPIQENNSPQSILPSNAPTSDTLLNFSSDSTIQTDYRCLLVGESFELQSALPNYPSAPWLGLSGPPPAKLPDLPDSARRPSRPTKDAPSTIPTIKKEAIEAQAININTVSITAPFRDRIECLDEEMLASFSFDYQRVMQDEGLLNKNMPACILAGNLPLDVIKQELKDIHVIAINTFATNDAYKVAFNKDVYHVMPDEPSSENVNLALTGQKGSAIRLAGIFMNPYIEANGQVSILFKNTTMMPYDGDREKIVNYHLLVLTAPAIDDKSIIRPGANGDVSVLRPEMNTYVDTDEYPPLFKTKEYKLAHNTLGSHILKAVESCRPKRVIVCAFGVNNFLSALAEIDDQIKQRGEKSTFYKDSAQTIAAKSLAWAIVLIRQQGVEVYFMDVINQNQLFGSQTFWVKVNEELRMLNSDPLYPVKGINSALGEDCLQENDLVIDSGDSHTLVGNKLLLNNSFDGQVARRGSANFLHSIACSLYREQ